jgi:hypothetical protein
MRKIGGVVYMDWRVMIQDGAEENKVRFSSIQFDSVYILKGRLLFVMVFVVGKLCRCGYGCII